MRKFRVGPSLPAMGTPGKAPSPQASDRGPLTLAELVERAGTSIATVSKVVDGRTEVASETRARVEQLIKEYGYRLQKKAADRAPLLELVFHEWEGPYALEIIKGAGRVARDNGLAVVLSESQEQHEPGKGWLQAVVRRRPTGVIAVFFHITAERAQQPTVADLAREARPVPASHRVTVRGIHTFLVDPTGEPGHAVPSVGAGNWNRGLLRPAVCSHSGTGGSPLSQGQLSSSPAGPASTATARPPTPLECRGTPHWFARATSWSAAGSPTPGSCCASPPLR